MDIFGTGKSGLADPMSGVTVHQGDPTHVPESLLQGGAPTQPQSSAGPSLIYGDLNTGNTVAPNNGVAPQMQAPQYAPQAQQYAPQQTPLQFQGYVPQGPPAAAPPSEAEWAAYALQGENEQLRQRLGVYAGIENILQQRPELTQKMYELLSSPAQQAAMAEAQAQQAQIPQNQNAAVQSPRFDPYTAKLQQEVQSLRQGFGALATEMQINRLQSMPHFDRNSVTAYAQRNGIRDVEQAYYALLGAWDTHYPGWRDQAPRAQAQHANAAVQPQQYAPQQPQQYTYAQQPQYAPPPQYAPSQQAQQGWYVQQAPQQQAVEPQTFVMQPGQGVPSNGVPMRAPQQVEVPRARVSTSAPPAQGGEFAPNRAVGVERMVSELRAAGFAP